MATGIGVGKVGIENILSGNYETLTIPSAIALVAAIVSIVGKEAMYWYTRYYAKLIRSPPLWLTRGIIVRTLFLPSAR